MPPFFNEDGADEEEEREGYLFKDGELKWIGVAVSIGLFSFLFWTLILVIT